MEKRSFRFKTLIFKDEVLMKSFLYLVGYEAL